MTTVTSPSSSPAACEFIPLKDVCEYLGVSDDYLRKQIKDGKLRAVRFGDHPTRGRLHIRRGDLESFIDAAYIN